MDDGITQSLEKTILGTAALLFVAGSGRARFFAGQLLKKLGQERQGGEFPLHFIDRAGGKTPNGLAGGDIFGHSALRAHPNVVSDGEVVRTQCIS